MIQPFIIFLRALGIYLLVTIPTIGVPAMYLLSAYYALTFGWAACPVFLLAYYLVSKIRCGFTVKWNVLLFAVAAAVALAHTLIGISGAEPGAWELTPFLCFPGAAIIAGWVSLFRSRKSVKEYLEPEEDEISSLLQ
jgi:hypothetical protein